jgi:hypothetical protein
MPSPSAEHWSQPEATPGGQRSSLDLGGPILSFFEDFVVLDGFHLFSQPSLDSSLAQHDECDHDQDAEDERCPTDQENDAR